MEEEEIFNKGNISDEDLANDQRQEEATSFCFAAETVLLPESGEYDLVSTLEPASMLIEVLAQTLEPLFRRVVAEELELKLEQNITFTRPSPVQLPQTQALEIPCLKLVFPKNLSLPIFTGNKILNHDNYPLQIILVDLNSTGDQIMPISLNPAPKVELVVLNGDFPPRGCDSWTSQEFDYNVVKERNGKPPLIIGDLIATLKHGVATFEDIEFTDNSSWIPTKKFKFGARLVAPGTNASFQGRVLEAIIEVPFAVREYRMG
ncbi:hypothetical protein TIFTF001_011885 [Ficus carica]|uniref:Calmodulin binding protein-like N-terminal domain-containing protein n=1 Tax=Ficus carica TaxID=3494 RepID=A0AA88D4P5_FICCA|nr:hypothetical protein TIFTF001_011885 [Ficus carica]